MSNKSDPLFAAGVAASFRSRAGAFRCPEEAGEVVYVGQSVRGIGATRRFLELTPNLQLAGRNGMHRYDNQDHAMLTGILAARNVLGARYNVWDLRSDSDHQEEGEEITASDLEAMESRQPLTPAILGRVSSVQPISSPAARKTLSLDGEPGAMTRVSDNGA